MLINKYYFKLIFTLLFFIILTGPAFSDKAEKKAEIMEMEEDTLTDLYQREPNARKNVQKAAGYAVFSNFGMKIFFAGGGKGSGVAVNNKTKKKTFMKMVELQAGLGFGIKKFKQVCALSVQPGVWLYQITEDGLALELTGKGTKYYKDGDLN